MFSRDDVIAEVYQRAGNPDLTNLRSASSVLATQVETLKADLLSIPAPLH